MVGCWGWLFLLLSSRRISINLWFYSLLSYIIFSRKRMLSLGMEALGWEEGAYGIMMIGCWPNWYPFGKGWTALGLYVGLAFDFYIFFYGGLTVDCWIFLRLAGSSSWLSYLNLRMGVEALLSMSSWEVLRYGPSSFALS